MGVGYKYVCINPIKMGVGYKYVCINRIKMGAGILLIDINLGQCVGRCPVRAHGLRLPGRRGRNWSDGACGPGFAPSAHRSHRPLRDHRGHGQRV
jgi:hypothetical protein